jgi:hypothetical protein
MSPRTVGAAPAASYEVDRLQRSYGWSINSAIETGRSELAAELADSYAAEARDLTDPSDLGQPGTSDGDSGRRSALETVNHYVGKVVRPRGPLGS